MSVYKVFDSAWGHELLLILINLLVCILANLSSSEGEKGIEEYLKVTSFLRFYFSLELFILWEIIYFKSSTNHKFSELRCCTRQSQE